MLDLEKILFIINAQFPIRLRRIAIMNRQKVIKFAAAAAAILCFASCGKIDDNEKKGSVTLATLRTSTTTAQVKVTTGPELTMSGTTAAQPETSETETTKKTKKEKETTTTKKTETTTATTTQKPATQTIIVEVPVVEEPQPEEPQPSEPDQPQQPEEPQKSFAEKVRISYNGQEFSVGDNMGDVEGRLGDKKTDNEEVSNGVGDHTATIYHYDGMDISVFNGVIYQVTIESEKHESSDVKLVIGVGLGASSEDVVNSLGNDGLDNGGDVIRYNLDGFEVQVNITDGSAQYYMIKRPELA